MSIQLLITMRAEFAEQYAKDRSSFDPSTITNAASSVRLIGPLGYSMRVSIAEAEEDKFRVALEGMFIVEPDYALRGGPGY